MGIPVILLSDSISPASSLPRHVEVIRKPGLRSYTDDFFTILIQRAKNITVSKNSNANASKQAKNGTFRILCIGASTGGPTAVSEVLRGLGRNFPYPILYAQHIEIGADKNLADWMNETCTNINVKLAKNGDEAKPGTVYMAPADKHLVISYIKPDGTPVLELSDEAPEHFLRPAVNVLFRSAAEKYRSSCLAILLTGMGADGAEGCKKICDKGGWTIVEDKSTCAVFGMPAAAIEIGGAKEVRPRPEISKRILELVAK